MGIVEDAVAALRAGDLVVLPTDTVYGLCAPAHDLTAVGRIDKLKKRPSQAIALVAASTEALIDCIPELRAGWQGVLDEVLPGAYTLVLPNPKRRLPRLSPGREETIGVRVPELPEPAREVLTLFGVVAASSANHHHAPDPRSIEDVPEEMRAAVAVVIDAGELPGVPSTVIDLTGAEPRVLREGAGDPGPVLAAFG
jgi:tRNA threonylcarbamoyl adenosine modification protein (Sua5/YciO/YrdC/YwlC family)